MNWWHGLTGSSSTRQRQRIALASFEATAKAAAHGDLAALAQLPAELTGVRRTVRAKVLERRLWELVAVAVADVCEDDILSAAEESRVAAFVRAMGLRMSDLRQHAPVAWELLAVARINDGRPPILTSAPMVLDATEKAYAAYPVALLKEVAVREYQSRSSGVSVPLGLGIRYRTGSSRGRSVVIGSELVAADAGTLVVTSRRAMFLGTKKTLEFRRDKLVGLHQYTDGLRLSVSNRQSASVFRFGRGDSPAVAAALLVRP